MKSSLLIVTFLAAFLVFTKSAHANTNDFTSCLTPTGTITSNYTDGTHGIVGEGSRVGSDTVYLLPNGNSMQCFCSEDGNGIQTNWQKATGLTSDEIKILENQDWIYVPDGSAWGLSDEPYLAKNISYSCKSTTTTTSSGGGGRTDGKTDGRSDGLGSIVQAASGNLASTGNLWFIAEVLGLGVFLTIAGLLIRFKAR